MQLWFARGSEVSIREQLVTQVVLGILSDDLEPGQRLPSTRELARRFHLHPNTISAGYRQLERDRWVEFRRGSGVYVRDSKPEVHPSPELALDQMIARLFRSARKLGVSLPVLRSRLRQWLELQPPDHFLLIEPDEELRALRNRVDRSGYRHCWIFCQGRDCKESANTNQSKRTSRNHEATPAKQILWLRVG